MTGNLRQYHVVRLSRESLRCRSGDVPQQALRKYSGKTHKKANVKNSNSIKEQSAVVIGVVGRSRSKRETWNPPFPLFCHWLPTYRGHSAIRDHRGTPAN